MLYVWVPSPELSLSRIRDRVEAGGHNVPEPDVRRRFARTLTNLFSLYRPLLDSLHFFDNSSEAARLIFKDDAGCVTVFDESQFETFRELLKS